MSSESNLSKSTLPQPGARPEKCSTADSVCHFPACVCAEVEGNLVRPRSINPLPTDKYAVDDPWHRPTLDPATVEACAKVAEGCNIRFYRSNSSGALAHQIDYAREDVVSAIRALTGKDGA